MLNFDQVKINKHVVFCGGIFLRVGLSGVTEKVKKSEIEGCGPLLTRLRRRSDRCKEGVHLDCRV